MRTRREFLKLLGKGAAGAALGICALEMAQRARQAPDALDMEEAFLDVMYPKWLAEGEIGTRMGIRWMRAIPS